MTSSARKQMYGNNLGQKNYPVVVSSETTTKFAPSAPVPVKARPIPRALWEPNRLYHPGESILDLNPWV